MIYLVTLWKNSPGHNLIIQSWASIGDGVIGGRLLGQYRLVITIGVVELTLVSTYFFKLTTIILDKLL